MQLFKLSKSNSNINGLNSHFSSYKTHQQNKYISTSCYTFKIVCEHKQANDYPPVNLLMNHHCFFPAIQIIIIKIKTIMMMIINK